MSTWPSHSTSRRPARRHDGRGGRALAALRAWYLSQRERAEAPEGDARVAEAVVGELLDERERAAVLLWLAGTDDAMIEHRTGVTPGLLAQVREQLLAEVRQRLRSGTAGTVGPLFGDGGDDEAGW